MYLGIDVGGTHTDAVVVDHGEVVASCKVVTNHDNLLVSVRAALDDVMASLRQERIERVNLSTTLSTNAIVEHKNEEVGVLVSSGPGIDPEHFRVGRSYYAIDGFMDHRGFEVASLDEENLEESIACCNELGLRVFAAVGKFSTRNAAHERLIRDRIGKEADFVSMGHSMSGLLNFPRRVATAYYNASVWRLFKTFADAIAESVKEHNLQASVNILKADGGTMPLSMARLRPVESILSGPAASVMGVIALCDVSEDCIILDIGGTTTDIAVFASGAPVVERDGVHVGSYPTLVQGLDARSIGIGGDSRLSVVAGKVQAGPERLGPCMAKGGKEPALMDAMNYLNFSSLGDKQASRKGVERLAALWDMFPDKLARQAVDYAVQAIKTGVDGMLADLNAKPVYTIHELLKGATIDPRKAYIMGGPAKVFARKLSEAMGRDVEAPEHYDVANAVGAALTRTTMDMELFADTEKKIVFIPTLGVEKRITASYNLDNAVEDARQALAEQLEQLGLGRLAGDIAVSEANSFNMVDFFGSSGKNIRVKCQVKPGISR